MSTSIRKVSFIGSGNVATHLAKALHKRGVEIGQIFSQQCDNSEVLAWQSNAKYICDLEELNTEVDLLIFAIKDEAIRQVAQFVYEKNPTVKVVHTSGSVSLEVFNGFENSGIFYPLQSFSKSKKIDIQEVPILITANNPVFKDDLMGFARLISDRIYEYTDEQRKHLHVAAVFVNNFSNHLFAIAQEYCNRHQLEFEMLLPLIRETIHKIDTLPPKDAQTGPAKRNDKEIIEKHIALLQAEDPQLAVVYRTLSDSIMKMYFPADQ